MKRLWPLALLAALCLSVSARAAGSAELVRTFVYDDTLYAYVDITGADQPITKADAGIGGQTFPASDTLRTVRQAGSPVTYLLLLDASTSMPGYAAEAAAFAGGLAEAAGENTRFTLATFGEDFSVLAEDLTGETMPGELAKVAYTQTQSRLSSGITGALDYFEAVPRSGSELRAMVILTDAVEYDPQGGTSYEAVLDRACRSDVMLHTVGFGGDAGALEQLAALAEASRGGAWVAESEASAREAAGALAEATGALYVTGFDLTGYTGAGGTEQVSVTFGAGAELVCRAETSVELPGGGADAETGETPETVLPPSRPAETAPAEPEPETEASSGGNGVLTAAVVAAAAVVLAVVLILVLRRRKRPLPQAEEPAAPGVYLRMEVLQGACARQEREFTLSGELLVGRDSACDIVFLSDAVSRKHARVFLAGGVVYVEDLGSQNGTAVNGAPIRTAAALRSGDRIAVGDAVFQLKF